MAKRHERTRARRCALQMLYTSEIQGTHPSLVATSECFLSEDGNLPEYAQKLVEGVEAHQIEIDQQLASTSENWSLARMPMVDRSLLRLATYEMLYMDDVPISVTINEAVELAKDFGGEDDSPRFVNGVLGRIARRIDEHADVLEEETRGEAIQDTMEQPINALETDECNENAPKDILVAEEISVGTISDREGMGA